MKAEIITIGDEILIGQIVDTNSQWIGTQLNNIGVSVYQITSIQDDESHILEALKEAEKRVDIVILTGGLGPTKDDITKKTIAKYFNDDEVVEYEEVILHIKKLFSKINHPYNDVQRYQAQLPSKATLLMNDFGTAPGMWFYERDTVFVSLPGVPYEMKGLMKNKVLPMIQDKFELPFINYKTIQTYGEGESIIAEKLSYLEDHLPSFIKLAYLPSFGSVRLRLSGKHKSKEVLEDTLTIKVKEIQRLLPNIITGIEEDGTIEKQIGKLLKEKGETICTAESLTGGKIGATLVSVPGASSYYMGGFITYTADLKEKLLGVSNETIQKYTVVSEEVAKEMAEGALHQLQTDYAIAVTGNAGPTTDNNKKNVGVVCIALASKNSTFVKEYDFGQPREKVINKTINKALELLKDQLLSI